MTLVPRSVPIGVSGLTKSARSKRRSISGEASSYRSCVMVRGLGFGVCGLGFGFGGWSLGFGVGGWGLGVWGLGFGVWGLRFGVYGVGFKVQV